MVIPEMTPPITRPSWPDKLMDMSPDLPKWESGKSAGVNDPLKVSISKRPYNVSDY